MEERTSIRSMGAWAEETGEGFACGWMNRLGSQGCELFGLKEARKSGLTRSTVTWAEGAQGARAGDGVAPADEAEGSEL
jgi:hypothetical protein